MDEKALERAYETLGRPDHAGDRLTVRAAITAYLQALSPGSAGETEGWVLVPKEPTWAMQIAGRDVMLAEDGELDLSTDDAWACYRAMLSAAGER